MPIPTYYKCNCGQYYFIESDGQCMGCRLGIEPIIGKSMGR